MPAYDPFPVEINHDQLGKSTPEIYEKPESVV
jgi:hypothetical protein